MAKTQLASDQIGKGQEELNEILSLEQQVIKDILCAQYDQQSELVKGFFSVARDKQGREAIVDFLQRNVNSYKSFKEYEAFNSTLRDLPLEVGKEAGEILLFFLDQAPSIEHAAYCVTALVMSAAKAPEAYQIIAPKLVKIISQAPHILQEELNEFFVCRKVYETVRVQNYLRVNLNFQPINETPALIDSNIEGVPTEVNLILKKVRTDMIGENRNVLKAILSKDIEKLLTNPVIKFLLITAGQYADIYIHEEGGGAGTMKSQFDEKPIICLNGGRTYIMENNINLVTALVHESTHVYLDLIFDNDCNPFKSNDLQQKMWWNDFARKVVKSIEVAKPQDDIEAMTECVSSGYNEFLLLCYAEDKYTIELPAFLVQEVSTRILCNIARQPIIFQFKEIDIMGFLGDTIQDIGKKKIVADIVESTTNFDLATVDIIGDYVADDVL